MSEATALSSSADRSGTLTTTDQLRQNTTALVLRTLRDDGPLSRAALAQRAGLSKATVGAIAATLLDAGVLHEDPTPRTPPGGLGRPGRALSLDGAGIVGLGLEVNVDYLAVTAIDLAGRTVLAELDELDEQVAERPGRDPRADLTRLSDLARRAQSRLQRQGRSVLGVGVAVPGLIDRARGVVLTAPNLGWHDVDLAGALSTALPEGCPIRIDNDANYAAAAEASAGVARGVHQVLYLTGTVGLGGGIVVDGQVQRGAHGFAGEVGHLPIGDLDARCACGRMGCWETSVGLPAMVRAVAQRAGAGAGDASGDRDPMTVAGEIAARAADDPAVAGALEELGVRLGRGLVTLAGTLDPGTIVLGGYFVPIGRWLVPAIERSLDDGLLGGAGRRCSVALSTLGLRAASTGAAGDILADLFTGAIAVPAPAS